MSCWVGLRQVIQGVTQQGENKNAGGAGGFTRTIIETKKQEEENGLTHILLMDDDVVMQPESIYRTYKILTLLKEEYKDAFIGGECLEQQYVTERIGYTT